jgi:hypothetical protein
MIDMFSINIHCFLLDQASLNALLWKSKNIILEQDLKSDMNLAKEKRIVMSNDKFMM